MQATNDNPVLNNPYEEPKYYYDTVRGNLDYNKVLKGRRPYMGNIDITPSSTRGEGEFFSDSDFSDSNDPNVPFINSIRDEVKKWREKGYPDTTRITRNLLDFWFVEPRQNNLKLFFCQREAVETAIYLNEVADHDPNMGRYILHQLDERLKGVSDDPAFQLPRTAFKMATGTGKTVVMAMLILYNYLNKREYHNDTRFVDHFLLVTPGVTIRERLNVLYIDNSHTNIYDRNDYYHRRGLIPRQYEQQLGGLNACIQILNYQQLEPKLLKGKHESPLDVKMIYKDGSLKKNLVKEGYPTLLGRLLKGMKGKRVLVINDEAHHCYLPKNWETSNDEEANEGVEENKYAMIWYEGLRQMKLCGYKIQHVYDLSATPYFRKGSGYQEYSLFPWVVSDFGLVEAIESGLVKIPFFPAFDTTTDEEPKFLQIYKHIRAEIPKKGLRGKRKQDQEDGNEEEVDKELAPKIPALLRTALDQFYKDYEDYERGLRGDGEAAKDIFTTPPVFIVVCNNTFFSKEVYKELAGWETVNEDGELERHPSKYDLFSNYDPSTGLPRQKSPTLLVDSVALDSASDVVDDDFKRIYAKEIEEFKREYAIKNGSGSADKLKDADIMREIVNSVGKEGTLGADIRCVVSVGMLTEGWDANTVTHVCGVRAFGSQLLCEQVVGRALRRRSYDLAAYDKDGVLISDENIRRYKPENITFKFPPEYAHIIGVPFKNFKGGTGTPPPPPRPKTEIKALENRRELEIKFPNVIGYKSESIDEKIEANYTGVDPFVIDFRSKIPQKTHLASPINNKDVIMQTDVENLRDHFIIFYLTQLVISEKYSVDGPQFQKFNQLMEIVDYWYHNKIQIIGGNDDMRRFILMYDAKEVVTSIYAGIHQHNVTTGHVRLTPILNFYNPEGSSRYVHGYTSLPTIITKKSHVDRVAGEDGSWQQITVNALERCKQVKFYVRNHYLEFYIPYLEGTTERNYMPDFIAVVNTLKGETIHLLLEISHFTGFDSQKRETIRRYVNDYWVEAVNTMGKYGRWAMLEINDVDNLNELLNNKIKNL